MKDGQDIEFYMSASYLGLYSDFIAPLGNGSTAFKGLPAIFPKAPCSCSVYT